MPQPQEAIVVAGLLRDGLNNDNLIKVFRHGRIDGRHYGIDMELCDFDMHQYIKQRRLRSHGSMRGKRGPYEIIQITKQVAGGLAFIHRHQLVHRDVKPKNSTSKLHIPTNKSSILGGRQSLENHRPGHHYRRLIRTRRRDL